MVAVILLAISLALAHGSDDIEQLKNDYKLMHTPEGSEGGKHRLSGWVVNSKNNTCDMVRRKIKTFGYCWNDDNVGQGIDTTKERGWVREVIQQWEKCGNIKFVEEPTCRRGEDFVTVTVGNYGPVLSPSFDRATCKIYGFTMYIDFYTFGQNIDSYRKTEKIRKSNVQMYALHEFGHFLGFDHEHNRKDRTECYWQVDEALKGDDPIYGNYPLTKDYDIESIMNYCRPNVHYKPYLSLLDKKAIAEHYGENKINWQECDAATQPWKWDSEDGLEPSTLNELNGVESAAPSSGGGSSDAADSGSGSGSGAGSGECVDVAAKAECNNLKGSCKDEAMLYWCPVTCNRCDERKS